MFPPPPLTPIDMITRMRIRPARRIRGRLSVPGDKSISHRAAIFASLANGTSTITNFATGADCAATVSCLKALGVAIAAEGHKLIVQGRGRNGLKPAAHPLNCGNSASTMRLLAGVLAGQDFFTTLIGDESLSARPMMRIIEPLQAMGATVNSNNGQPPLTINGTNSLTGIVHELPVRSAQVKSCILLAGLNAAGLTKVSEPLPQSRDHTERMMQWFGGSVSTESISERQVIKLEGPLKLDARDFTIPGDISSAAYFVAAAGLLPNSDLTIENVGLNPTRMAFLSTCEHLGLTIEVELLSEECNEPRGRIHISGQREQHSSATTLSGSAIAPLIDELPLLAILGSQTFGGIEIRDAEELRLKESDRIATTVRNLRAMGATVKEFDDGMIVNPAQLRAARIETEGDHRIAMAFAIAALLAEGESEIADHDCVDVSYPGFFEALESIVER